MSEFMKILLSLSVSGALLLLLLLGLKPLYKNKFSKRWQYYIWIVVALRFLLPFTPDTTIIGSLFEKFDTTAITNEIPTTPNVPVPADTGNSKAEPIQTNREITTAAMREPVDKYVCLFFIWSALALVLFVRKVTVYQGFIQYIKAGNKEVSDIKILNLLSDCEEKLNIKTRVELSCNPLIASPMLIGFFRPRIILPSHEWEDKELSYIFVHELIHYKQRDMFYKWLIQIVVCVHWFNPFVYLLEKEVNKSCELSCDEKVIAVLDDKARREYGDTLISFLKSNNLYKSSLASVTLTEGAEQLKERLGAIMKFKKKSKGIIAITAIFSVLVCVCFFVTGAYAASPATNNNLVLKDNGKPNEVSIKTESDRNIKETENKTEKTENQYSTEYAQHGITVTDGIYYYHGERVRIFMDLRMNGSFENFIFDNEGSIDLRVLRDKNNSITNVEYLTESEADELLYDMDEYSPDNQLEVPLEKEDSLDNSDVPLKDQNIGRSVRVTKEELSEELRDIISSCDTETWYVIKSAGYQYIYFGGLPYNYTFQPEIYTDRNSGTVNVFDMGTTTGNYVLLEIQQNVSLTINYNGTQISYTEL